MVMRILDPTLAQNIIDYLRDVNYFSRMNKLSAEKRAAILTVHVNVVAALVS